jgi:curved DNA-binding protein CbpA
MADKKTHYEAPGVAPGATTKEIKAAYRKLSKQLHPDFGGSTEAFAAVSVAADVLLDDVKRADYDRELKVQEARASTRGSTGSARSTRSSYTPPRDYEPPRPKPQPPKIIVPCSHCGTKNRVLDLPDVWKAVCGSCKQTFMTGKPEPDSYGKLFSDMLDHLANAAPLKNVEPHVKKATDKAKEFIHKAEKKVRDAYSDDPVERADQRLDDFDEYLKKLDRDS